MASTAPSKGLQLRSLIKDSGELELSLQTVEIAPPGPDEVVVRVEATPINPSDLGLLIGPADVGAARLSGSGASAVLTAPVSPAGLRATAARVRQSLPVGNEGAGVVVAAGSSPAAQALMGKTVAILGGAMYAQYRTMRVVDCLVLPEGVTPEQGASCFVNPLTALGMIATMRTEGHTALVHTAAASNLGQMLQKACLADGIELVNIVRNQAQAKILRDIGARHVCDSSAPDFVDRLIEAVSATDATLAFDAIGGGRLASQILTAMEAAQSRKGGAFSRYGSTTHKQVYIYGGLDLSPTELTRGYGMAWGLGGWLLTPFLQKIGAVGAQALRERVAREITTTFASHYTRTISLTEALQPDVIAAYNRKTTGEKFLIDPSRDGQA
ncbi:MAG TPA: zinc-binding dehydrogenase [Caulobacteraceae bacterium]|jgi:NADPH:quinone reductase-like Zn-dependent oxidoreductase|nr:zinc-binding dehydrogenase [Caulobacteraceae bacterium]